MTPQQIRAQLILRGVQQTEIARQLGVYPSAVSMVIHRKASSRRIQSAIAAAIGLPAHRVFTEVDKPVQSQSSFRPTV